MAKYLLIQFDNDEEADAFAGTMIRDVESSTITVLGIYKKPTLFCECKSALPQEEKRVRGAKWGWWLCSVCHKPKKGHWQGPRNILEPVGMSSRERSINLSLIEPRPPKGWTWGQPLP